MKQQRHCRHWIQFPPFVSPLYATPQKEQMSSLGFGIFDDGFFTTWTPQVEGWLSVDLLFSKSRATAALLLRFCNFSIGFESGNRGLNVKVVGAIFFGLTFFISLSSLVLSWASVEETRGSEIFRSSSEIVSLL